MTEDRTTLHVRVEPTAETRADLRQRVRALEAGEDVPEMHVLSLDNRDFKEVHCNLTELATLNVLELREEGGAKRPVVAFDDIEVEIPVRSSDDAATV